jgi:hypothetical protein
MRKQLLLIFVALIILPGHSLLGQKVIRNSAVTGVCYAGTKVNRIYIPPPDDFYRKSGSKKGGSIDVFYVGFSAQARAATEYAVSILEKLLPADAKVTIAASWERIATAGVLGSTGVTGYVSGWSIDALNPLAFYPVSIAEKIAGESLNDDLGGDMRLTLNSAIDWYFGTDGNTPSQKYDLVTVILHELIHGIGFFDSMDTDASTGFYGFSSFPIIYDTFLETFDKSQLTDTSKFKNNSLALKKELTGGRLFFSSPILSDLTQGGRARLYAPSTWDPGSSVSHLDEDQTVKPNTLMTPFIDKGEAIHDPGKQTFAMLGDLGWINTRIIHKAISDTEKNISDLELAISVKSDTSFNRNKVGVVYSYDGFKTSFTTYLSSPASDNNFSTKLAIPSYNTDLQYYFVVEDYFRRIYKSPSLTDRFRYQVYIGSDTIKPIVVHTPADYLLETIDSLSFDAVVTDNIAVDTVYLEYKVNSGPSKFVGLKSLPSDKFRAVFSAGADNLEGGDSIRYRIIALDSSYIGNIATFPKTGFQVIAVEEIKSPVQSYATNFNASAGDFFNVGFSFEKPKNFSGIGLHTPHPYVSPEDNDKSINYTALLRYPLKFGESGLVIKYKEIVLVEPGENGSVFGTDDFYDYVVLEASKDFGKNWIALEDGYDSRIIPVWESLYSNSIENGNSTYIPDESMFRDHSLYVAPAGKFSDGDTLLLRFRLYSDPFANGWGWVIDDLKINPLIDAVDDQYFKQVAIYPNPGEGVIRVNTSGTISQSVRPIKYRVFSSSGIQVSDGLISGDNESIIDISGSPQGLYIIVLYTDQGIRTSKYSKMR